MRRPFEEEAAEAAPIKKTPEARLLSETRAVCPECLRTLPARRLERGGDVFLARTCPEHGRFETVVWRGEPAFESWRFPKTPSHPDKPLTKRTLDCPRDCGLCPEHGQRTCCALIEVTSRCNLRCSVCFADAGGEAAGDVPPERVREWLRLVMRVSGPCNIHLSGGEPTVRDDLPEIVAMARAEGFTFIQINTNGLRLAEDPAYAEALARAGASTAFLQFDALDDEVNRKLRGRPLLRAKLKAVERCAELGIGVVLAATLVPGLNDGEAGDLLRLAASLSPGVRGMHFQPVSWFGRYPGSSGFTDASGPPRLTLPELMRGLETQTGGLVRASDFSPPSCEHALCSFHANYLLGANGELQLTRDECGCCSGQDASAPPATIPSAAEGLRRTVGFVARQWSAPPASRPVLDDFDRFLERSRNVFAVSGMAFQDAWSLDLERLNGCCIHCVSPDGRLVPFCAYNLTDAAGRPLHRGRAAGA